MEQPKISLFAVFKFVFSAIFTHITLYLPIMLGAYLVVMGLIYLRQYLETTALISSMYLDILSIIFGYIILASCFWGACVVIAARILYGSHATLSVFMQSLRHAPQFICIYAAVKLPSLLISFWPAIDFFNPDTWSPPSEITSALYNTAKLLSPVIYVIVAFFVWMWTLYGQLAIPAFVIEQQGIIKSLALSFHHSNKVLWKIIEVGISFGVFTLVVVGLIQGGIYIGEGSTISTALWQVFENKRPSLIFVGLEFPILALAYVYIYKYAQQKSELVQE